MSTAINPSEIRNKWDAIGSKVQGKNQRKVENRRYRTTYANGMKEKPNQRIHVTLFFLLEKNVEKNATEQSVCVCVCASACITNLAAANAFVTED